MRRHLGYMPETSCPLPHLTVRELLHLVSALKGATFPPDELIARLAAGPFMDQTLSTLSQGQRRRACLLGALVGDPWLLVLDEPTNGLNPEGHATLVSLLKEHIAGGSGPGGDARPRLCRGDHGAPYHPGPGPGRRRGCPKRCPLRLAMRSPAAPVESKCVFVSG